MYREHPPGPMLAPLVECFWTSSLRPPHTTPAPGRVLPDGCMDILFDFIAEQRPGVTLIGTMTRPQVVAPAPRVELLGVRFHAGGLPVFLSCDASELTNASQEAAPLARLRQRLGDAPPARRIGLLRAWLESHLTAPPDPYVQHCVARIESSRGQFRAAWLERSTGLSARQLERKFLRHVGLPPKTFARVVRFRHALAAASAPRPPAWAGIAAELGYADQPHLVREFKSFAGLTPTEYRGVAFVQDPPARNVLP